MLVEYIIGSQRRKHGIVRVKATWYKDIRIEIPTIVMLKATSPLLHFSASPPSLLLCVIIRVAHLETKPKVLTRCVSFIHNYYIQNTSLHIHISLLFSAYQYNELSLHTWQTPICQVTCFRVFALSRSLIHTLPLNELKMYIVQYHTS